MTERIVQRGPLLEAALVVFAALGVRALHLLAIRDSSFFVAPVLDSAHTESLIREVAAGKWAAGLP